MSTQLLHLSNPYISTITVSTAACSWIIFVGSMLLAGGSDGMVRIFGTIVSCCKLNRSDVATCSAIMGWPAHTGEVSSVRFSRDETSIISVGADGRVCVLDIYIFNITS